MDKSCITCLQQDSTVRLGCLGGLLSTFFPSTPRSHLLQVEEERTNCPAPHPLRGSTMAGIPHPRNLHNSYLLRAAPLSLHTLHRMLAVAAKD